MPTWFADDKVVLEDVEYMGRAETPLDHFNKKLEKDEETINLLDMSPKWDSTGAWCSYESCPFWDKYCAITGEKLRKCDAPQPCQAVALKLKKLYEGNAQ